MSDTSTQRVRLDARTPHAGEIAVGPLTAAVLATRTEQGLSGGKVTELTNFGGAAAPALLALARFAALRSGATGRRGVWKVNGQIGM